MPNRYILFIYVSKSSVEFMFTARANIKMIFVEMTLSWLQSKQKGKKLH